MKATIKLPKQTRYALSVRARPRGQSARGGTKRLQIKKILVPVDFSPSSHQAVKFALPLLKKFGAELHLIHVLPPDVRLAGLAGMPIMLTEAESAHRARTDLKRTAKRFGPELQNANIHAAHGEPFEEICRLAREIDIDLIVMPTRGQTGFKHLLLGSTAERVVRYSPCPILVLKPQLRAGGNGKFTTDQLHFGKILVPIDFSECSKKGLNYAKAFALEFKSKLIFLNSVVPEYYVTSDEYARYDLPILLAYSERAAQKAMARLAQTNRWNGLEVETSVHIGHAGQQLCGYVDQNDVDLIVTSTHGRTGFKHVLVGSTAEYVVQHAKCPVLVVPSHERTVITSRSKQ